MFFIKFRQKTVNFLQKGVISWDDFWSRDAKIRRSRSVVREYLFLLALQKASEKLRKKPLNLAYYARDKFKIYPREQKILCLREILRITKQKYAQAGQASPPSRFFTSSVKSPREITTQKPSNFARQTRGKESLSEFKCFLSKFYLRTKEILYLGEILRVTKRKIGVGWTS